MKKICLLSLLLLGMLCLHACGGAAEDIPFDSMQNLKTKTTISLGMPQEEVEAHLGAGRSAFGEALDRDPAEPSVFFYGADGDVDSFTLAYWEGYAYYIGLTWNLEELTSSNWQVKYGITKGSRVEDAAAHAYQIEFVVDGETGKVRSFYICDWDIAQRAG